MQVDDDGTDDVIDDDEAKQLLDGGDSGTSGDDGGETKRKPSPADADKGDPSALGDPGKKALDAMKRERNAAKKDLADLRAELKSFKDKDKSETERLQEARDDLNKRASAAEDKLRAFQVAMDRAPAHATLAQVKAVAKRVRGESDDELEDDADELFGLLAPAPPAKQEESRKTVPGRPRERLRGGADPDEEPEESDPRKLADMIRRR